MRAVCTRDQPPAVAAGRLADRAHPVLARRLRKPLHRGLGGSIRFRRATGVERLQLLWLTYGANLIPLTLVACLVESRDRPRRRRPHRGRARRRAHGRARGDRLAAFRYRLFDIELIFSRTLLYAALTACVVAGYLAFFLAIDRLISIRGVAGVAAAGLVAMGFQPLREVLQRRVHRLVYGDRSDPYGRSPGSASDCSRRPIRARSSRRSSTA